MTRPRILVIDDDEAVGETLQMTLVLRGYPAVWRPSLAEADRRDDQAEVIVLDLNMPGHDGFTTIDDISRSRRHAQLIIASGQSEKIIAAAVACAKAAGIAVLGALEKPYTGRELVDVLDRFVPGGPDPNADDAGLIQAAIADGTLVERLRVVFQSKRDLKRGVITGYEALARLAGERFVSPELMFGAAVPLDLQLQLTRKVFLESIAAWQRLNEAGSAVPISVNCNPQTLCHPAFLDMVEALVRDAGLPPSMLLVELTEHASLEQAHQLARAASRLAMLGFRMALDDFGRGTTSYERLTRLPLAEIKIDKDIFWSACAGEISMSMLREVVSFCHANGMAATIEGIECELHRREALALGADFGQGFLWDKPGELLAQPEPAVRQAVGR